MTRHVLAAALLASLLAPARAEKPARDGRHDFDFAVGTFRSRVRRLQKPLTGSTTWVEGAATVSTRQFWDGLAQLEEVELDMPAGHLEALTLRLYNPATRQWSLHWAKSSSGVLAPPPAVGEFHDGRGEFYDQETYDGKTILVRHVFSGIGPNGHHFEQAFSADMGRTWEVNWIADLSRIEAPDGSKDLAADRNRDFDFQLGQWKTHVSRLLAPLTGSTHWADYGGTTVVTPVWQGRASLLELHVKGAEGAIEGIGLRLYDPNAHEWSLNWVNARDPVLQVPTIGAFHDGRGEFLDVEPIGGHQVFVRNLITRPTARTAHFEQAFSPDAGKTWEANWQIDWERPEAGATVSSP